jgi:probable serine/threonine protein kinase
MELSKGEKNFLQNVVEKLKESEKFSVKYEKIYEFDDKNLNLACSSFQNWLNNIFRYMNSQLKNRYFHAQDSREFISLDNEIDSFISNLHNQKIELHREYKDKMTEINKFICNSGGTTVPDSFSKINIVETEPIFYFNEIVTKKDKKIKLHPIGKGSYAEVYKYYDEDYEEWFAVKKLKIEDLKEIERFKNEFNIMKKLNSPFIVKVYKFLESENKYIMEYLDMSLYDYIQKNELTLEKRKKIIFQILACFLYLSKNNILHRDVSPKNILVKKYDDNILIKVSDFGLVKTEENFLTSTNTENRGSLNDPQLKFKNYEIRHEIYALTQLIVIVLTGKINFSKIKDEKIKEFLEKGTNTIENRFQTMKEFSKAVKEMIEKIN